MYWSFQGANQPTHIERIEAEFKSHGLVISKSNGKSITINKKGQKKLYQELEKRFDPNFDYNNSDCA